MTSPGPKSASTLRRLSLPQVTLCAVSSVAIPQTMDALSRSMAGIRFGDVKFLTDADIRASADIDVVRVPRIGSRAAYSRFILNDLQSHIITDHVLIVQWDGFVINPKAWSETFLDYDYIGAIWPHFTAEMSVGNGGFSLRSKRLIQASAQLPHVDDLNEDVAICRTHRQRLEREFGVRFADVATASRFAYERTPCQGHEFGFHGSFNMPAVLGRKRFADFYASVDIDVFSRRDHRELIAQAMRDGDRQLARAIVLRHLRSPERWKDLISLGWPAIASLALSPPVLTKGPVASDSLSAPADPAGTR